MMRRCAFTLGLILLSSVPMSFGGPGYSRGSSVGSLGLVFSAALPKDQFTEGEAIPFELTVVNATEQQRTIPAVFVQDDPLVIRSGMYLICQQDRTTLLFQGLFFKASEAGLDIKPGGSHRAFTLDLAKCFDLVPGTYDIQVLFSTRYSGFVDAASNRLTLTVKKK